MSYKDLTVEQKIGRVLCARIVSTTTENYEYTLELLRRGACSVVQVRVDENAPEKIKQLRAAAKHPILIINDMEQGYLPSGRQSVPLLSLAACDNPEYTRAFAAALASDAKAAGFSGCWGPVVDILHCDGPVSVSRRAGDSPEGVLKMTREIASVFKSYNFQSTAKHYPGGAHPLDTHMVEGVSDLTEEELLNFDLVPYLKLNEEGLMPSVMTAHMVFRKIDPDNPASLSKKVIDIIRNKGYDGVIYTDSLAMMGILQKYGEKIAMAKALMAGNDVILPNYRTSTKDIYEMMLECYREGLITDEALDEANRRIEILAEQCAQIPENPEKVPENIDEILASIARDSITAECQSGTSCTLNPDDRILFIVIRHGASGTEIENEITFGKWYSTSRVIDAIKANFPNSEATTIAEFPECYENERVLNMATKFDKVVFVTYCGTNAYTGTDGLTRRIEAVITCLSLSGKVEAIVHFGNPLALANIPKLPRRIFGYMAPQSQQYAFEVLAGKIEAKGKNPFPRLMKN